MCEVHKLVAVYAQSLGLGANEKAALSRRASFLGRTRLEEVPSGSCSNGRFGAIDGNTGADRRGMPSEREGTRADFLRSNTSKQRKYPLILSRSIRAAVASDDSCRHAWIDLVNNETVGALRTWSRRK